MSFVQQFTEQQLSRFLGSHLIQQLQTCHSAVEDLICHLEALRTIPKVDHIESKIFKLDGYLSTKQQLITILQDNNQNAIVQWLIQNQSKSGILGELLQREGGQVGEMMQKITKRVFLREQSLQEFIEETEMVGSCLSLLKDIREEIVLKRTPSRDKVRNADQLWAQLQIKIEGFGVRIQDFNQEMAVVVRQFQLFEETVRQQFKQFLINRECRAKN